MSQYEQIPNNQLPNGLTLLQVNPDMAADLNAESRYYGWLFSRGAENQWVTLMEMTDEQIEMAHDQAADMTVLNGAKVRGV